jgi:hypothetical protein
LFFQIRKMILIMPERTAAVTGTTIPMMPPLLRPPEESVEVLLGDDVAVV